MRLKKLVVASFGAMVLFSCSTSEKNKVSQSETSPKGRAEYEFDRIKDPATGTIPVNIHVRELAFSSTLPKVYTKNSRESLQNFKPIGPRNVGGRTRAVSFDIDNPQNVLAGGVSGGMWRSTNLGSSWKRVTNMEDQSAVSCIIQDTRSGKSNIFYYGSGESVANSASKSFSANYLGSGLYKSTNHGATWIQMQSTEVLPHKGGDFKYIYNVAIDPSRNDSDILYVAVPKGIQRSNDGGITWKLVLGGSMDADFTNIIVTTDGAHYATFSSDVSNSGFWRSDDGLTWVKISPPNSPSNISRTLVAFAPGNTNSVYFFSIVPVTFTNDDLHFWKYSYISGNGTGSGGNWDNRTANLPPFHGRDLITFNGYCMSLAVKPDDENVIILGGNNLFRSLNGFSSSASISQIGGYDADGYADFNYYEDNQHPDQQSLAFDPSDPNKLLAGTDGGLHYTSNSTVSKVIWETFNNGYQTTQFYGIGIDHETENEITVSGYQDNGSWWTDQANSNTNWKFSMGGDGSYCAVEKGATGNYYLSSQNGSIRRVKIQTDGSVTSRKSARPQGIDNDIYLFNHPFILNPANNNQMYLPHGSDLWRNSDLSGIDTDQYNWTKIASVTGIITTLDASLSSPGVVYVGTRSKKVYKIEDNGTPSATVTDISNGITNGGYSSCITVDPNDANKVMVIYSNYNTISAWYSEDAGDNWTNIEGNLKGISDPGVPPNFDYIGSGPSFRWARIIPTIEGNAYLLGTSIGLFATNDILADSVIWIQQAADVIGNVVIEQIDHRISDGFCVVSTHGAGAFKTYFDNNYDITSAKNIQVDQLQLKIFPNPVTELLNVEFENTLIEEVIVDIMNSNGQVIKSLSLNSLIGSNKTKVNVSNLSSGVYYLSVRSGLGNFTKSFVK